MQYLPSPKRLVILFVLNGVTYLMGGDNKCRQGTASKVGVGQPDTFTVRIIVILPLRH